ncbi:MAG: hypothetical protein Q9174_007027 [Haloplaca sp. 1 TL-2023]
MAKGRAPKTWAEEIAELDDPAPRDLDPEQVARDNSSEDDDEDDPTAAREHYIDIRSDTLAHLNAHTTADSPKAQAPFANPPPPLSDPNTTAHA